MIRRAVLACALVLGQGCAAVSVQEVSRPSVEPDNARTMDDDGWVTLARARIAVAAHNDRDNAGFIGPGIVVPLPIFPMPASWLAAPRKEPTFWIDVAIDPEGEGFAFDPSQVRVSVGAAADLAPVRMKGPSAVARQADRRYSSRLCGFDPSSGEARAVQRVVLTQMSCVSLEFDVAEPTPDVTFTVRVRGLSDSGQAVAAPAVNFSKARRTNLEVLP